MDIVFRVLSSSCIISLTCSGDILYEKSKFDLNEQTGTEDTTTVVKPIADLDDTKRNNASHSTDKTHSTAADKGLPVNFWMHTYWQDSQVVASDVSGEDAAQPSSLTETKSDLSVDINNEEFECVISGDVNPRGPLTKCLEEEDSLILDDTYVPNNVTVRVKVFLPNKHPVYVIMKRDATVQETIEKTIRKSNALSALFQKKYQEKKEELLETKKTDVVENKPLSISPPLDGDSPVRSDIDGFSEFLDSNSSQEGENEDESLFSSIRVDLIPGYGAMTLITDSMAYELRMEMEDGEYDMDFPGMTRD